VETKAKATEENLVNGNHGMHARAEVSREGNPLAFQEDTSSSGQAAPDPCPVQDARRGQAPMLCSMLPQVKWTCLCVFSYPLVGLLLESRVGVALAGRCRTAVLPRSNGKHSALFRHGHQSPLKLTRATLHSTVTGQSQSNATSAS